MTGPTTLAGCAVAHELADAHETRSARTQTSRHTYSESHMKSTLSPYKDQILDLAMRGGVFHVKAKADAEFLTTKHGPMPSHSTSQPVNSIEISA